MRDLIAKFLDDVVLNTQEEDSTPFPYLANNAPFVPGKSSVYYSGPYWNHGEIAEVIHSMVRGKWLSSGEKVARFEKHFGEKFGLQNNVMVNSGSSANLVMIASLKKHFDWQDGDEIIVCACGFPTSIAPIVQNGLTPVFVDINWQDLNWNMDQVQEKITPKTRAVLSSPVLGNPYDYDRILEICDKANIKLIADNCDSLGSKWRGKYLTDWSVAASCSFYPAHHICTMEGGMVSSNDPSIIVTARSLSWWGRDCHCVGAQNLISCGMCGERFKKWLPEYDGVVDHKYLFSNMGYNLKPLDLQGGVGLVQLTKWEEIHQLRRQNKQKIGAILEQNIPDLRVVGELEHAETSWFGVPVVCSSRAQKTALVAHLESNKVQTRNYFAGNILMHPGYKHLGNSADYPLANQTMDQVFFLGCSPTITEEMIHYIETVVKSFGKN